MKKRMYCLFMRQYINIVCRRKRVNRIKSALETETRYVIQIFAQYECSEYGNDFYELINDLLQDIEVELKIYIKIISLFTFKR